MGRLLRPPAARPSLGLAHPVLVLGIDAAWTQRGSTGVALAQVAGGNRVRLVKIARSYGEFVMPGSAPGDWTTRAPHDETSILGVLQAAMNFVGEQPSVVAVDIPLSPALIGGRRRADDLVSKMYGRYLAPTHSPTPTRPGPVSALIFGALTGAGFAWCGPDRNWTSTSGPVFIETYPHPAIIEFLGLRVRLAYKVDRRRRYFPSDSAAESWEHVTANLDLLRAWLTARLEGMADLLPPGMSLLTRGATRALKGLEDALDAAVCAAVAAEYVAGRAAGYGDQLSAIWLPRPGLRTSAELANR
jgi:predicted RNase H-like nuclease